MEGPIRILFPLWVIAMWVVTWLWVADGLWTGLNTALLVGAFALCTLVFRNFVWVFSYSYALTALLLNAAVLVVRGVTPASLLVGGVCVLYGLRLLVFVHLRNQSQSYASNVAAIARADDAMPMGVKVLLFVLVGWLMTFQPMTTYLVATNDADSVLVWVGGVVALAGLVLETVSDVHKQRRKAVAPTTFVADGPFRVVRHPNYLGEIAVQVGLVVAAVGAATQGIEVVAGVLAPTYIAALMLYMAVRGDRHQAGRYADDPTYQAYRGRTGSLLPRLARRTEAAV